MFKYCVDIIESERGWGQRIDEQKLFDDKESAKHFNHGIKQHNIGNDRNSERIKRKS